jgi:hypothetical protein
MLLMTFDMTHVSLTSSTAFGCAEQLSSSKTVLQFGSRPTDMKSASASGTEYFSNQSKNSLVVTYPFVMPQYTVYLGIFSHL